MRALINNAKKKLNTHALLVDATHYYDREAFAIAVGDIDGYLTNVAIVQTSHVYEADEKPIVHDLQSCQAYSTIYANSKAAARTFAAGLVARSTGKLTVNAIRKYGSKEDIIKEEKAQIYISWFSAHMRQLPGLDHCNPIEEVNHLARELTRRAADNAPR